MEAEVTEVAGPKGKHNPERIAYRHGTEHVGHPRRPAGAGEPPPRDRWPTKMAPTRCTWSLMKAVSADDGDHMVAGHGRSAAATRPAGTRRRAGGGDSVGDVTLVGEPPVLRYDRRAPGRVPHPTPRRSTLVDLLHRRFDFADHTMIGALGVPPRGQGAPRSGGGINRERQRRAGPDRLASRPWPRRQRRILFVLTGQGADKAVRDVFGERG